MPRLSSYARPQVLAHRMLIMGYPENTILSLKQAIELGVDWVEFDVKVLKDGTLVSCHDGTVDRTTDGTGDITKMTLPEVRKLNAGKGYNFGFVPIPTVEEILKELSTCGKMVRGEMHIHNLWEPEPLVELLDKYNMRQRAYFNTNIAFAEHIREDCNDKTSLISLNVDGDDPQLKDICNRLDISYLCVGLRGLNADFVNKVHHYREKNPVFIQTYPVNSGERDWQKYIDFGVDVVQTDFPEALFEYLESKGFKL
jgi:glycerophosphoryl diester phosphodiesterase